MVIVVVVVVVNLVAFALNITQPWIKLTCISKGILDVAIAVVAASESVGVFGAVKKHPFAVL